MSRVYFHSKDGTAELRGSERAYAGCMCEDLMIAAVDDHWSVKSWIAHWLPTQEATPKQALRGMM